MNTRMDVVLWGAERDIMEQVFCIIQSQTKSLEKILSRFDPDAEVATVNSLAVEREQALSPMLWSIFTESLQFTQTTLGYFNVVRSSERLLVEDDFNSLILNPENKSVFFSHKDIFIDFGGIGKGYALRYASHVLEKYKIENALLSFGESSVLTRGAHPLGDFWPFALTCSDGIQCVLELNDGALSISGLHNGDAHITDPVNGKWVYSKQYACVCDPDPVKAEAYSTALYIANEEKRAHIEKSSNLKKVYYYYL